MNARIGLAVALVLSVGVGCKKKQEQKSPPPTPAEAPSPSPSAPAAPVPEVSCRDAAKQHNDLAAADTSTALGAAKASGTAEEGMVTLMKYSFEEFCDQYWTPEIRACIGAATTGAASNKCFPSDMLAALDQMVAAEIADMAKTKAENEAAAGSATP